MRRLLAILVVAALIAAPLLLVKRINAVAAEPAASEAKGDAAKLNGNAKSDAKEPAAKAEFELVTLRGKVDFLAAALARRYGIKSVPEAAERQLVLDDPAGELHPLAEDVRGRAFRADPRLREFEVELLVRRYKGSPVVQVIQVFAVKEDGKYELDYWCDVCAIAMYELKPCDCCQAPNYLRERLVKEK